MVRIRDGDLVPRSVDRASMIRFTLELPWGWTIAAGIGRAGAEDAADGSAEPAGSDSTHGDYTIAQGPYSTDFRGEEPWYEEDRGNAVFGFCNN